MPNRDQFKSAEEYNIWFREYRAKNRLRIRAYNRKYNKKWRKVNGYSNEENSNKRYPEKVYARRLFQQAIRQGKIKRGNCETCAKPNAQGHHVDYFKPLEVIWLCALHHKHIHK